jgi:shikimate kinase
MMSRSSRERRAEGGGPFEISNFKFEISDGRSAQRSAPIPARVFLVGFMGCGKTTVGRLLAERLDRRFLDLDDLIVQRAGQSIARIFAERGEGFFRALENELLCEVVEMNDVVIALGGGAFVSESNRQLVKEHGVSIWLDCPIEIILERLAGTSDRPLNQSPEQMRRLLETRKPSYALADVRIEVGRSSPAAVVQQILHSLFS